MAGRSLTITTHVYALHMLDQRLQILVSAEQRQRLEREASHRGVSVGSLIREAIDAHVGAVAVSDRERALDEIRTMRVPATVTPDELDRLVEEERDERAAGLPSGRGR